MSMTTVLARTYIARVIGGAGAATAIDAADEALRRGYADWQTMRNWDFLLKDNTQPVNVTGLTVWLAAVTQPFLRLPTVCSTSSTRARR
jgi:hypothetical protein